MQPEDFFSRCLLLDIETDENGEVYAIGGVIGERVFGRTERFDTHRALLELDSFANEAEYLLGHNLLHHDLPILRALGPSLRFLTKPVVDTLYLSPLAFPQNPYHRLVKDYKLVRDTLNDPVADARLAAGLFRDQWDSFTSMQRHEARLLPLYNYCFRHHDSFAGLQAAWAAMGVNQVTSAEASEWFRVLLQGKACSSAVDWVADECLTDPELSPALAYCIAWLCVAGGNSILPPWVRRQFPNVAPLLHRMRDIPCSLSTCSYCREIHNPETQLQKFFDFPSFRSEPATPDGSSLQRAIVHHTMADHPVLAILPTGGGKSLCYQLPALVRYLRQGVLTIVISPLQALMKDQVDNLRNRTGVPNAAALYGLLTAPERGEVLNGIRLGDVALLYVSPEQLRNRSFREAIRYREIGAWVFDEAHCLSKWGHDFRPDYLYAARFIKEFAARQDTEVPPVQCFTATAKQDVKAEILDYFRQNLGQELTVFEGGVERRNLSFEVQLVSSHEKFERLHDILTEHLPSNDTGCAIIYCATQANTEVVAEYLARQGWQAEAFHAGLPAPRKKHIQDNFIAGITQVICATTAFGMGIDKEDVRLVIHVDIPGSLENYLQEAGRAGRDQRDAKCILLYDEDDIETQFRMAAHSQLSRKDIAEILRSLRKAKRNQDGDVIITVGELLRDEDVETSFSIEDRQVTTKVRTAVAWLERAEFLERNENRTQVFQGRPLVQTLEEASDRIGKLRLSERQQARWLAILEMLMNASADEGLSVDQIAEHTAFKPDTDTDSQDNPNDTEGQRVLRTLHDMAEAGLIHESLMLSAFVRYKVKTHSLLMLERVGKIEEAMIDALMEAVPDAGEEDWQTLSLRRLNQRLLDQDYSDSSPDLLRNLLHSLWLDSNGCAGSRGGIDFRYCALDLYQVKLQRDWNTLRETAQRRRHIAAIVLGAIMARIPKDAPASAELLVDFSAEDLLAVLRQDMIAASQIKDPLTAIDRALMFLHEQRIITLQKGLAVFRQAMTIRIAPEGKGRGYSPGDYEPLQRHYGERAFQIHVMNEYARKGLEEIRQALALMLAYFSEDKATFIRRFFAGRKEMLERATCQQSFERIVEDLHNPVQAAIVAAPEDRNILILAGPGSGKSRVVVHRCAYLIRVLRVPPKSILVLCFNHHAAVSLRQRLRELIGADAKRVVVLTYHGLALRLTGRSLVPHRTTTRQREINFDALISEAVDLLRGKRDTLELAADEIRDRLLAGYRHILVDEYQDIDQGQYDLISALAGRTLEDADSKLTILAVGDDDQNIYRFRGANVDFIHRFRSDYQANIRYLLDNYRSSAHIIAAANRLIADNRDRMKTDHPIHINRARAGSPTGGRWEQRDSLTRGQVHCMQVRNDMEQAEAALSELERLRDCDGSLDWSDCAVLAWENQVLALERSLCEEHQIPFSRILHDPDRLPPPFRIRENRLFLDWLSGARDETRRVSELIVYLDERLTEDPQNPWWQHLRLLLDDWRTETDDSLIPVTQTLDCLSEALAEQRRDRRLGHGLFLSTIHSAKGMEFKHVVILDGGFGRAKNPNEREEERRLYYVAMTRARETLCLMQRQDVNNPFLAGLDGDFFLRRPYGGPSLRGASVIARQYSVLGLQDLYLDFAGLRPNDDPIHSKLANLRPGSPLHCARDGNYLRLYDGETAVAALSRAACEGWQDRLHRIESVRVLAMIRWHRDGGDSRSSQSCKAESWEVPMVEVVHLAASSEPKRKSTSSGPAD